MNISRNKLHVMRIVQNVSHIMFAHKICPQVSGTKYPAVITSYQVSCKLAYLPTCLLAYLLYTFTCLFAFLFVCLIAKFLALLIHILLTCLLVYYLICMFAIAK